MLWIVLIQPNKKYDINIMPLKTYLFILILFMGCKCRFNKESSPTVYRSIESSKDNKVFIEKLHPQSPFLYLDGKEYHINEAWLEYAHLEKSYSDVQTSNICVVVTFYNQKNIGIDLHLYVNEMGTGVNRIWYAITSQEFKKDTIPMFYRETLGTKEKNKVFLLFK